MLLWQSSVACVFCAWVLCVIKEKGAMQHHFAFKNPSDFLSNPLQWALNWALEQTKGHRLHKNMVGAF